MHQPDAMDCAPACLGMIAKHYGKDYDINSLRSSSYIGFKTVGGRITFEKLAEKAILPCIVD
ncbi:cysteine peptidase family C39 domain-containing protein [Bacteroides pyogenes]|nr:cysteine peptidase family C39 domain-containing protein [Bacteroides pyogenes]